MWKRKVKYFSRVNLCLIFEGAGRGVAGKITNVTRLRDLCVDDVRQFRRGLCGGSEAVERMSERADTAYSPRFREEEPSDTAERIPLYRIWPIFSRLVSR